jgi:hypothetical protein
VRRALTTRKGVKNASLSRPGGRLQSGKLRLTPDEAIAYRTAAERLHDACDTGLDLAQPVSVEDWILLQLAQAALAGSVEALDQVIAAVESAIRSRADTN